MRYSDRALAGLFFLLGGVSYTILTLVAETAYPDYSTSANYISDLGVGPTSAVWTAALLLAGLLGLGGTYLLYRALRPKLLSARGVLLLSLTLFAIGAIGVGIFNEHSAGHGPFATVAFVFGGLASILSAILVWGPIRFVFPALGILGLGSLVLFSMRIELGLGPGGIERMIVLPVLLSEMAFGAYLAALPDAPAAGAPA